MQTKAGFAEVRIRRDEAARPVEFSLFDENGRPIRGWRGVSRWTLTYDARGNQVREDYFDETGPSDAEQGWLRYDDTGVWRWRQGNRARILR